MKKMKKSLLICLMTLIAALCLALAACGGGGITFKFVTGEGAPFVPDAHPEAGTEYTLPTPEWEGHSFEGWYSDPGFSGSPVTSQMAEENTTFYAKWETMFRVTLDAAGGTLDTVGFYLKAGENLGEAVKSYIPAKTGFEFGEWLNGKTALSANAKMPAEDITLTAHYKVGYTIEVYLQDKDDAAKYTKSDNYTGYAYADGKMFTPDYAPEGYEIDSPHEGESSSLVLDANDPAKNVFKIYYNVLQVTVNFYANDPERPNLSVSRSGEYGDKIELPTEDFTREGYLLAGWSSAPNGENQYPVVHATHNLPDPEMAEYVLTEQTNLYAVWTPAYRDLFNGEDYIFVTGETIYLERAGFLFSGTILDDNIYIFQTGDENLQCKIFDNGKFCYSIASRKMSAKYYDLYTGKVDDNINIYFTDGYNSVSYSVKNSEGLTNTSTGTYSLGEDGFYTAHFTEGTPMDDLTFTCGYVLDDSMKYVPVFIVRNDEEYGYGEMSVYMPSFGEMETLALTVKLDGCGGATVSASGQSMKLVYYYDSESFEGTTLLVLYDTDAEELFGAFLLQEVKGAMACVYFDAATCGVYDEEGGTGKLDLDGLGNATFTKDGKTVRGYYVEQGTDVDQNTLVYVFDSSSADDTAYVFALKVNVTADAEGNQKYVFTYTQYLGYLSLQYATSEGTGDLMLVAGMEGENTFTLYYSSIFRAIPVAKGTFAENEGTITATVTQNLVNSGTNYPGMDLDLGQLKAFTFVVLLSQDTDGNYVYLMSWESYTLTDGTTTKISDTYTQQGGGTGALIVTNAMATYQPAAGTSYRGTFTDFDLYCALSVGGDSASAQTFYFILDKDARTYQLCNSEELDVCFDATDENGATFLFFDGLGHTYYCVAGNTSIKQTPCTVTDTKTKTAVKGFEFDIYHVKTTPEDGDPEEFDYILIEEGYFIRGNGLSGEYTDKDGNKLVLDGFYFASYTPAGGQATVGMYIPGVEEYPDYPELVIFGVVDENEVEHDYFFDLHDTDGKKTFSERGVEFGDYLLIDNGQFKGEYLSLDGNGNLTVYIAQEVENNDPVEFTVAEGTYEIRGNNVIGLDYTYSASNQHVESLALLDYYLIGGYYYYAVFLECEDSAYVYLNPGDWTVLQLDGYSKATRYNADGTKESGSYTVIADGLLYFVNDSATDAGLYHYDNTKQEITAVSLGEVGYFTEKLNALLFTSYGFVLYEDERLCFYDTDASGNVILYYSADDLTAEELAGKTPNKYGFVAVTDEIGKLEGNITFEGMTFYRSESFAITFTRAGNANEYLLPVQDITSSIKDLTFEPQGGDFETIGEVKLDEKGVETSFPCIVTRAANDSYYVIFALESGAELRITIAVTYRGEGKSTYTVTGMAIVVTMQSYQYLYYSNIAAQLGSSMENDFGVIEIVLEYDAAGEEAEDAKLEATFGESSGFYDANGELIESIEDGELELIGNEEDYYYKVTFTAKDNKTYHLYFEEVAYGDSATAYYVLALTREQEIVIDQDLYKVVTERLIATDSMGYEFGQLFTATLLTKASGNNTWTPAEADYTYGNTAVFISGSSHFVVTVEDNEWSEMDIVPDYKSAAMQQRSVQPYTTAQGDRVVFYTDNDRELAYIIFADEPEYYYPAVRTEKSADGSYYTVTLYGGAQYKVTVTGNSVILEEITSSQGA